MNSHMEKPYVVGIDIGGTNSVFGVVDTRGKIIAQNAIKTQTYVKVENYVNELCQKLLSLINSNGGVDKIKGIGVGAPNGNYYSGTIEFAPNLPWKGVIPLAAMIE
ncbi:Glucokinase, partial [termite gut metagenome]